MDLIKQLAECPYLMSIHLNDNGIWTAEFLELNNLLDLFGIISEEIEDEKLRRVVIDRPRLSMQLSNMATVSQKRDVSPRKQMTAAYSEPCNDFQVEPTQDSL